MIGEQPEGTFEFLSVGTKNACDRLTGYAASQATILAIRSEYIGKMLILMCRTVLFVVSPIKEHSVVGVMMLYCLNFLLETTLSSRDWKTWVCFGMRWRYEVLVFGEEENNYGQQILPMVHLFR